MRVHQMSEPDIGWLVTGTHDIAAALDAAWPDIRDYAHDNEIAPEDWVRTHAPRQETGRFIPAQPDDWAGVKWWWRSGCELGKPGVTRAVVIQEPTP